MNIIDFSHTFKREARPVLPSGWLLGLVKLKVDIIFDTGLFVIGFVNRPYEKLGKSIRGEAWLMVLPTLGLHVQYTWLVLKPTPKAP